MPIEKSAGAVVFRKEKGKLIYLLIQYGLGHWGFPRGNLAKGESWQEAAEREIVEETDLKGIKFIHDFKEVSKFFYKKDGETIYKIVTFFLAETTEEEIKLSFEHKDYKWLEYNEAFDLITYKDSKETLKKAENFLKKKISIISAQ